MLPYVQVSRKRRVLMVTLQKSQLWPEDEPLLPKLDIDKLPLLPDEEILKKHMVGMFIHTDTAMRGDLEETLESLQAEHRSGEGWDKPKDPVEAAVHDARESIQILFVKAWQKVIPCAPPAVQMAKVQPV